MILSCNLLVSLRFNAQRAKDWLTSDNLEYMIGGVDLLIIDILAQFFDYQAQKMS